MAQDSSSSTYFLSASQETSSRSRLFRPKELREFVFPGVGMIMHSLFWVKHSAHLHQQGIDPSDQEHLLLYAETEDDVLYDEGLLWYILSSRLDSESDVTLTAGVKTVKNWLFEPQYDYSGDIYDRVADELHQITTRGKSYETERFVEEVFSTWFVTRCRDLDIDLDEQLRAKVLQAADESETANRRTTVTVSAFCELIGRLVCEHDTLRSQANLTVIGSTIQFARQLLISDNEAQISVLADTSFRFHATHTAALLQAVAAIEHGHHFVRSILFVTHIGPSKHSGSGFEQEMRHIHDIVTANPEGVIEAGSEIIDTTALPAAAVENIDETSYYWLLNFFMADGETIARTLLDTDDPVLWGKTVESYFDENKGRTATFEDFLSRPDDGLKFLPRLLAQIDPDDSPRMHRFLSQLLTDLEQGTAPPEVLLHLLETNGALEREGEASYRIREFPTNTNSASFYGIGPLRNWTETLLTSNE